MNTDCPFCHRSLSPYGQVCPHCESPVPEAAKVNPYHPLEAEMFAYQEGSEHSDKPLVFVGTLLLLLPLVALVLGVDAYLLWAIPQVAHELLHLRWYTLEHVGTLIVTAAMIGFWNWIAIGLILKTVRSFLRGKQRRHAKRRRQSKIRYRRSSLKS